MTNFKFANNIETANAAKAAEFATANRSGMNEIEAIQRIIDLTPANDGMTRAVIVEVSPINKDIVFVGINRALSVYEKRDIARQLRPAVRALGGRMVNRFRNGKRVVFDVWQIPADNYKAACAARNFWRVEDDSLNAAL